MMPRSHQNVPFGSNRDVVGDYVEKLMLVHHISHLLLL